MLGLEGKFDESTDLRQGLRNDKDTKNLNPSRAFKFRRTGSV